MRIKAGTIGVDLTADGKDFETTLKRADNLSEAFSENVDRRMKRAGNSLKGLGQAAGLTDKELAGLEQRMRDGLAADSASRALDQLKRYAGLTSKEYASLAGKIGVVARESEKASLSLGSLAKRAGAAALAYLSFREGARVSSDAFASFREYESALTDMARVTDESLGSVDARIKAMPRSLGDPTALMQGYYQVLSSGVTDAAASMDLLTTAAKAAKAAHIDQGETVKALTKLMAGYDGEIKSAAAASDLLFRIDNLGQTSFAELVPVIGDLAEVSHLVGVSAEEMASGLALITQTSGSTSEAATKWKAVMVGLYKPTENLEKVLKALGYQSGVAMVQQLGFAGTLQTLQAVAEKSGFAIGKLFDSSEALTGIAGLSAQEWGRYVGILDQMRTGANETDQAFARWLRTSQAVKDTYDATIKQMAIEFGGELAPLMIKGMTDFSTTVQSSKDSIITALGGIAKTVEWITSAIMAATREYQRFSYTIAAAIAVVKGEMSFKDLALSGPDELAKKLQEAGDRLRAERDRQAKEAKTQTLLTGENNGTIPELQTMFPDLASQVETAKKEIDAIKVSLKDGLGSFAEKAINDNLLAYAQKALSAGVKYELGAKSISAGRIDCSGFVEGANETLFKSIGDQLNTAGIDQGMVRAFSDSSEGIITRVHKLTGQWWTGVTSGIEQSMLRPGMLIGFDTGPTKFDAGRALGIDHIVQVVQDITGALQVIQSSSSGGGVNIKSLESYLAAMKNAKAFVVDPYASVRDKSLDSLGDYQKYADGVRSIQKDLSRDIMSSTLDQHQYKRWAVDQEIADIRNSEGYLFANVEQRKAIEDQLAQYRVQKLREVSEEEARFRADSLRDFAQMSSQIGELSGNMALVRTAKMQEVQAWADALLATARQTLRGADLERMAQAIQQLQGLKGAETTMDTATSFAEYADAFYGGLNGKAKLSQEAQQQVWQEGVRGFAQVSTEMARVRLAAYDQILAYAARTANAELAMFAQVNREAAMATALQNIQQYGSPGDAFAATLSLEYGGYKSEMTRTRENYVALAKDIKTLSSDMFSSFSTAFGSILKGLATGSLDMQEIWATLLGNLGDMFAQFGMKILERWFNDLIGQMLSGTTSSLLGSGLSGAGGGLFSLFGFDKGGAFAGTTLPTNTILTSPTLFTTADSGFHAFAMGGVGVAGEGKDPEAIVPLKRLGNGDLGIQMARASEGGQSSKPTQVNATVPVKVINVLDCEVLGDYMKSAAGEKIIVNVMRRNGVM